MAQANMSQSALHYEQGKLCYQNKKFQDAIFQFTEAIRLKPENQVAAARCHNARGVVYFYLGEFKKVIKDCTKAIEQDPDNANYYNCRGNAYFSLGKFQKAADDFSDAIKMSPEASHGRYYNNRGSAYRRLKMFKEAIDDYTNAIAVDPKNGNYFNNRGNTYFDMGEFQLAIDDFTTALGLEPYSPKTKLTLAQAHEALAQEKRMKNSTTFHGTFSSLKTKQTGKKVESRRKDREEATIYVSPAGVEVIYKHGWRNKNAQQSFAWSEDMKIELVDETHVKLFLDSGRQTWVVIHPCDATAVEEELIGRITTKFASYSTACLVAQHEGVVNEYTEILRNCKNLQQQLDVLRSVAAEANKQKEEFKKQDKLADAEKSKATAARLEGEIKTKEKQLHDEQERAEAVRQKAEQEAGPVLDMVLIMQNRVNELYQTKMKGSEKYSENDLELKSQRQKMEALVARARELGQLVSKSVTEVRSALDRVAALPDDEDEDEDAFDEEVENFDGSKAPVAAAAGSAAAVAKVAEKMETSNGAAAAADDDDEAEEDWDDIDENALPAAFAPSGAEVFMSVESANGMVTIMPSRSGADLSKSQEELVMIKRASMMEMAGQQKAMAEQFAELQKVSDEAARAKAEREQAMENLERTTASLNGIRTDMEKLQARAAEAEALLASKSQSAAQDAALTQQLNDMRSEMENLRKLAAEKEQALQEKDAVVRNLQETQEELDRMRGETDKLKDMLDRKTAELEANQSDLSGRLEMTAKEKEELQKRTEEQESEVAEMRARLSAQQQEMSATARDALAKARRLQELEEQEQKMAETIASLQQQTAEEKAAAQRQRDEMTRKLADLENSSKQHLQDLEGIQQEKAQLAQKVEMQDMTLSQLRKHLAEMQSQLQAANQKAVVAEEKAATLEERSREDELKRRELHNLIQEIKGNIRVYIRLRPSFKGESKENENFLPVVGSDDRGLTVVGPEEESATGGSAASKKWNFEFDRIFWPRHGQVDVFKEISQLVQSALDGYKVSIFAYGQTGSGKTFTMEGPENPDDRTRGMIPRSVDQIFSYAKEMNAKGWRYEISASFLENYINDVRDLLGGDPAKSLEIKQVKVGKNLETIVDGLTSWPVNSPNDVAPLLKRAHENRASASTKSNERSSRSHSVFTLRLRGVHEKDGQESIGILNLVDLAGSERVDKSGVTGQRLEETKAINTSLTCLGDVIAALANGAQHVPFRNSKLTYMLQDCFGGGSKTLMFINLASELDNLPESISSLKFGSKVHDCHIGSAKKQVTASKPAAKKK